MPIFDQGYQHWSGKLTSHSWRWLAIARHGVRIGMKNRLLRLALMFAWLPAIVLAATLCIWGLLEQKSEIVAPLVPFLGGIFGEEIVADPKAYRVEVWTLCYDTFLATELRVSMLLVLLVGPSLISQDLRFNALPLYFSRPLRRIDYFIGKLGVIVYFLGLVLVAPSIIAYVLGLLFSLDITIVRDTFTLLLAAVSYGFLISLSAGLLILALSSLTRSSRYVGLFWLAVWFVSGIISLVLGAIQEEEHRRMYHQRMAEAYQAHVAEESRHMKDAPEPAGPKKGKQRFATMSQDVERRIRAEIVQEQVNAAKSDWRPLLSYTANFSRVGQQWLGTDACWERFSQNEPEDRREQFLLEKKGSQYPWYWSAIVLFVLFGISVCILNFRVKSLDRLK